MKSTVALIFGGDLFLKEGALQRMLEKKKRPVEYLNAEILTEEEFYFRSAGTGLFSEKRIIVIKDAEKIKFGKDLFEKIIDSETDDVLVILYFDKNPDWRKSPFNFLKKSSAVFEYNKIPSYKQEFIEEIKKEARKNNLVIQKDTAEFLVSIVGQDFFSISNAFKKIELVYGDCEITKEKIKEVCCRTIVYALYDLNDSLGNKELQKALSIFEHLVGEQGPQIVFPLLTSIFKFFEQLLIVKDLQGRGQGVKKVSEILNLPPFISGKLMDFSNKWSNEILESCILRLSKIETQVKSEYIDGIPLLETFIWQAVGSNV